MSLLREQKPKNKIDNLKSRRRFGLLTAGAEQEVQAIIISSDVISSHFACTNKCTAKIMQVSKSSARNS